MKKSDKHCFSQMIKVNINSDHYVNSITHLICRNEYGTLWYSPKNTEPQYLSLFRLLRCNTIDWVAFKQQKFISASSGDWKIQDHGTGRFSVWREPTFWFTNGHFSTVSLHGRVGEVCLWGVFYKGTDPVLASWPPLPKAPLPRPSHWGESFITWIWWEWGGTNV